MKSIATWSGFLSNPAIGEPANYWRRAVALIATLIRGDQPFARAAGTAGTAQAELSELRAQLAAMQRANLTLKQRLAGAQAEQAALEHSFALAGVEFSSTRIAELAALAYSDCLTGLANRHALLAAARREIARMQRTGRPACVVLVDIDHFKAFNDNFGHAAGDAVLKLTAGTLTAHTRAIDTIARWGGEEFVLLLPETDLAAAQIVAEKCRLAVSAQTSAQPPLPRAVTITLGVSLIGPDETIETAIARADAALYEGKASGRNRVVVR